MDNFETKTEFESAENDEFCYLAAEKAEIQYKHNIVVRDIRSTEKVFQLNISAAAKDRLETVYRTKTLAYAYLIDHFFSIEK